jgi:hypothetical protein
MSDMTSPGSTARATPAPVIVIAKFSLVAVFLRITVNVAILLACWYSALHPSGASARDVFENRVWWLFALVLTPALVWAEWIMLRQMIFRQGCAVWIEGGRLKIMDGRSFRFRSLKSADIQELSIGSVYMLNNPWGFSSVAIKMKGGWNGDNIMTLFLTDSAEVVRARLAEALSLPAVSN